MLFVAHQRIIFIGDSITDCGRRGDAAPYGNGYVGIVQHLLVARYPELGLIVINRGVSGNTVRDLAARWEKDVIGERPDWLSVMIGINDVWRFVQGRPDEGVSLAEYETTLRRLLDRASMGTGARLILMQPYVIEPNKSAPMRREMDRYGAVVERLARDTGAILIRTQDAWDTVLAHTDPIDWAADQIHPTAAGHAVIALAFLRAIGFELN